MEGKIKIEFEISAEYAAEVAMMTGLYDYDGANRLVSKREAVSLGSEEKGIMLDSRTTLVVVLAAIAALHKEQEREI